MSSDGYSVLDARGVTDYVLALCFTAEGSAVRAALCGEASAGEVSFDSPTCGLDLIAKDLSTGTLNHVWAVSNQTAVGGSIIVKQALPHTMPSLPRTTRRLDVEHAWLQTYSTLVPGSVPIVLHFDAAMSLLVEERLRDCIELRGDLIVGNRPPAIGACLGLCLARLLFPTSVYAPAAVRDAALRVARPVLDRVDNNADFVATTTRVWFEAPYESSPSDFPNRHTQVPAVIDAVARLRASPSVTDAIHAAKALFLTSREAFLHGDLHTGSLLLPHYDSSTHASCTFVLIDGEFACMGPIGFDVGTLLANLCAAWFGWRARVRKEERLARKGGYAKFSAERTRDRWLVSCDYLLEQVRDLWTYFAAEFRRQWEVAEPSVDAAAIEARLDVIYADTVLFAGAELARRIVGAAQLADFTKLTAVTDRAGAEVRALEFAVHCLQSSAVATSGHLYALGELKVKMVELDQTSELD